MYNRSAAAGDLRHLTITYMRVLHTTLGLLAAAIALCRLSAWSVEVLAVCLYFWVGLLLSSLEKEGWGKRFRVGEI